MARFIGRIAQRRHGWDTMRGKKFSRVYAIWKLVFRANVIESSQLCTLIPYYSIHSSKIS